MMPMMVYVPPKNYRMGLIFACPICKAPTKMEDAIEYEGPVNESGQPLKWGNAVFCTRNSLETSCVMAILLPWSRA